MNQDDMGREHDHGETRDAGPRTIDLTPTWAGVVPVYIDVLMNPKAGAKAINAARIELERMAGLADLAVLESHRVPLSIIFQDLTTEANQHGYAVSEPLLAFVEAEAPGNISLSAGAWSDDPRGYRVLTLSELPLSPKGQELAGRLKR